MLRDLETFLNENGDLKEKMLYAGVRDDTCLAVLNTFIYADDGYDNRDYCYGDLKIKVRSLMWLAEQIAASKIEWISFLHYAKTEFTSDIFNTFMSKAFNIVRGDYLFSTGYGILKFLATANGDSNAYESIMFETWLDRADLMSECAYESDTNTVKIASSFTREGFLKFIGEAYRKMYIPYKKSKYMRRYKDRECAFGDLEMLIYILNNRSLEGFEPEGFSGSYTERVNKAYNMLSKAYDESKLKNITYVREANKEAAVWIFKQFLESLDK